jgi:hypothetical protein
MKGVSLSIPCCVVCAAGILLINTSKAEATTINAVSLAFSDVSAAVAQANNGDTVVIPAGTAGWTSTLSIAKAITLQGANVNATDDLTVIKDNVPADNNGNRYIVRATGLGSGAFRITGITFKIGTVMTQAFSGSVLVGTSPPATARIDHCHFLNLINGHISTVGQVYGVIDHCVFDAGNRCLSILVWHNNWGGKNYGDGSWAEPPYFGSDKFLFIEDNVFNNPLNFQTNCNIDCYAGGRYVCRHNTFNSCIPNSHGTESPGRLRSSRAIEIYNNTLNMTTVSGATGGQLRGGTMLIHDNIYTGSFASGMGLRCYRAFERWNIWGGAFGTDAWDSNDATLYANGTARTSASGQMTDGTANFPSYSGYMIVNATTGRGSYITSNTATTITFYYLSESDFGGPNLVFSSGNHYEIRKVLTALDQPGRGRGDLVSGDTPLNSTTGTVAWPHQTLEPVYSWNNRLNGSNVDVGSYGEPTLQANRDYYNQTAMPGYTPYTYPHPLVTNGGHGPQTPGDLHIMQ